MTNIIVPIKRLSQAKQRLMAVLNPCERRELVLAMLQDLLQVLSEADCGQVLIVASDDDVFDIAGHFGALAVREQEVQGYNAATSKGMLRARPGNVCVMPGDIPLVTPDEIACLCAPAEVDSRCMRIAASHDRMGTNGLFQSSHNLVLPGFGVNSFSRYRQAARAAAIAPTLLDAPGMARDIDTPADLLHLAHCRADSATYTFYKTIKDKLKQSVLSKGVA